MVPVVVLWLFAMVAGCGDPERSIVSIEVALDAPRTASLLATRTQQATATATYNDDTTEDITQQVEWSSSNTSVATVNGGGLVTGVAEGTASISATYRQFMDDVTITVDPAILTAIVISGPSTMVPDGLFLQLTATGTFSDGTMADVTNSAMWSSNATSTATVDPTGEVQGVAVGGATITATQGGVSDTFMVTVTGGVLTSITINPDAQSRPKGRTLQHTATGHFSDGVDNDITALATWTSDTPAFASVNNTTAKGLVTYAANGTATISAAMGGFSDDTEVTVTDAVVDSILITPANPTAPLGLDVQLTCTATLSDQTMDDCTGVCVWTSGSPGIATVDGNGLVTASDTTTGTANVECDLSGVTDDVDVSVTAAILESIAVTPDDRDLPIGLPVPFTAMGTFSNGSVLDVTNTATWTATPAGQLTVTTAGIATSQPGSVAGPCTVRAAIGAINDVASCDLTAGVLTSILVTPNNATIPVTQTQQYTATGSFTDGNDYDVTQNVAWSSTDTNVATISNADGSKGVASALIAGNTSIGATFLSITGSTTLTVSPPPAPEIQFLLGASPFGSGGTNNLGSALTVGTPVPFTFTIQNLGSANLTLGTSTFTVQTGCTGAFTTPAPMSPLAPNATTTISGTVTPTAAGSITCTFSTPNNDTSGAENPYVIQLTGSTGAPNIVVEDALGPLTLGGVIPTDLQETQVQFARVLVVQNTGNTTLNISGASIGATDHCSGTVTTPPAATVAPNGSTTFTVSITPTNALGLPFACQVLVNSDDPETPVFDAFVFGTGTAPLGNFAATDGVWTGDGNCGIGQIDFVVGPSIASPNFPANPNTVFTLTGPNTASAGPNLNIFGAPGHTCIVTLPNGTQIRINCTNTGGGACQEFFTRAAQPEIRVVDFDKGTEVLHGVPVYQGRLFAGNGLTYDGLIFNDGPANLNIGAITLGGGTACSVTQILQPSPATIPPGSSVGFSFLYNAPQLPWECILIIPSNDPNEPAFSLRVRSGQLPF